MESQVDYLKLHSGASFSLPFDELVIFSTNLNPSDLIDPAFLRRIPYKIKLAAPSRSEYRAIFDAVAAVNGLEIDCISLRVCNRSFGRAVRAGALPA